MTAMKSMLAILVISLLASCGDSPEGLAEDSVDAMNDLVEVLSEIKTKADVEDAQDDIEEIVDRIEDLQKRGEELTKDMSEEEKKDLGKRYEDDMKKASTALGKEMGRIAMDPELRGAMDSLVQKMSKLK